MLNLHTLLKLNVLFWGHGFEPQTDHRNSRKVADYQRLFILPVIFVPFFVPT